LLLAFFLGVFGAHRFYVGRTGSAVVMLVFTCLIIPSFISAIWVVLDLIYIIFGAFRDSKDRKISW
jgi:TM2 domain-containing membrane protein YozV